MKVNAAAYQILVEKQKPLSSLEIAEISLNRHLVSSNSKTPIKSLAYTLEKNIREGIYNEPELIFILIKGSRYIGLPEWRDKLQNDEDIISNSKFSRINLTVSDEILSKIKLATQAGISDTIENTIIHLIEKGLHVEAKNIEQNISRQLKGLKVSLKNHTSQVSRREKIATNKMRTRLDHQVLIVEFENGNVKSWNIPSPENRELWIKLRENAINFAKNNGATLGQINAIKKVFTDNGYHIRNR